MMKKIFGCLLWFALLVILCLMALALIGVAAQAPGTAELIRNI